MNKIWKIGTNILTYIKKLNELKEKHGDTFKISKITNPTKIEFEFSDKTKYEFNKSTSSQFMRVWLSLGLIKGNNVTFEKDKDVLGEGEYNIIYYKNNKLGDYIGEQIIDRVKQIYEYKKEKFPTEEKLIFSIMVVFFGNIYPKDEKNINTRINNGTIESIKDYYLRLALEIKNSNICSEVIKKTQKYIVGSTNKTFTTINSIYSNKSKTNKKAKTSKYWDDLNINDKLSSKSLTFSQFIDSYFNHGETIMKIPIYQRKYIWTKNIVNVLLNDIQNIKNNHTHYLGNIIMMSMSQPYNFQKVYKIIDGQQRLTTLTIIARALFDYSIFKKCNVDRKVNDLFVLNKDNNKIVNSFQRIDGNDDFKAFKYIVKGQADWDEVKGTSSKILENYIVILDWMVDNLISSEQIEMFWKNLLNKVVLTTVLSSSLNDEYKLFEKLNTGIVQLTTMELFKNYILDKLDNTNLKDVDSQKMFDKCIESKFSRKSKSSNMEDFIMSYLREHNSAISNDTIFNQFRDLIEQKYINNDPFLKLQDFLMKLSKDIILYIELTRYEKYVLTTSFAYLYSDFLFMLDGRKVYLPLIIKILKNNIFNYEHPNIHDINNFRKFLRVIEIFEVRLQIATYRGQSLAKKIESILSQVNSNTTPKELWDMFNANLQSSTGMASISSFAQVLETTKIQNKPARLILTRIENYYTLTNNWDVDLEDTQFVALYQKPSQREHLLPIKWKKTWGKELEVWTNKKGEELEILINKYINLIGNALAIPKWSNNAIKNASLSNKKKNLFERNYTNRLKSINGIFIAKKGTTNEILSRIGEKFGPEEIKNRSKQIADIATKIWADYDEEI